MSNKLRQLCLFTALFPLLLSAAGRDERTVFVQMGIEESFIVRLKPGWRAIRRKSVDLCFEDFLIKGPENSFNLSMQFCYEDPEHLQYDTQKKQWQALKELTASLYAESYEKTQGIPHVPRSFSPGGRCGVALRLTAKRWIGKMPPHEDPEGQYVTCGLFRIGENSALFFQLWTNTVDDAAYHELFDFIAALCISERGDPAWALPNAMRALEIAQREFPKHYPAEELDTMRPYTVRRTDKGWIVWGVRWDRKGGTVEMELDGATGKVLKVWRGK